MIRRCRKTSLLFRKVKILGKKKHNKTIQQGKTGYTFLNGNYALIPAILVICVVPLIMRLHMYDSGLQQFAWFPDNNQQLDVFLYHRSRLFSAIGAAMVIIMAVSIFMKKANRYSQSQLQEMKQSKWLIPMGIFALLVFASTVFSDYSGYGFSGIYEQFESVWVVLSYCIATVYVFYYVRTKEDVDILQKALFAVLAVLAAIGLTQLLGHDFWQTEFGKKLFVPSEYMYMKDSLSFNFSNTGIHQVYLTFYNPNYVGVFAAVIVPIAVMLCIGSERVWEKAMWGILSVVLFVCALGSGSKAFLVVIPVTALLGIILYIRKNIKKLPFVIGIIVVLIAAGSVYAKSVNVDIIQYVKYAMTYHTENKHVIEDFIAEEDSITLRYLNKTLTMTCESNEGKADLKAYDEAGNEIPVASDENQIFRFGDERFSDVFVRLYVGTAKNDYIAEIVAAGYACRFTKEEDGYSYVNYAYRTDDMITAEAAVFEDADRLFSGRGYIWARTIPLLKEHILLGSGADTYSIEFPQNDYIARTNAGYQNILITKPHSMYLQYGVQYGVLALICFLTLAIMYVIQTVRVCWKSDFSDKYSCMALGIMMGITGYGIMGIANDSCVALAPLVWALLGLGFAVNRLVKQDK